MYSVEIKNLNKHYGRFHALKDINLQLREGEFVVMVGPSGCGKSTLLRTIAGLEDASDGEIFVNGRDVTHIAPRDRGLAMVFQNYALYPHLTVAENMGFALRLARQPKAEIDAAVRRAAETLQLTDHLDKKPRHLSGGQRQRVAIGRAIVRQPEVFLFDEPLSNLDAALRAQMRVELGALHQSLGASMIYVTHDQVEAMTMADRIVLLRGGLIEQVGSPLELYNRPASRFVAGFLGAPKMNFFAATIAALGPDELRVATGDGSSFVLPAASLVDDAKLQVGSPVSIGLRPEHFHIANNLADGPVYNVRIVLEERLGRETVLYADSDAVHPDQPDQPHITIHRNVQSYFKPGDKAPITFSPEKVVLFDADGRALRWPAQQ
ncbi:ABC transporter ATP-binding protein [Martelella limonii]|uniref:ABC transporter ATP-binding protein n=1 Tax=Martelella limonii TaxID=1647649 RepID=UPI0015804711|nr:ABC transporter ATP-binding protein [Martelella limonii]